MKTYIAIIIAFCVLIGGQVFAQCPFTTPGTYVIEHQDQVDNFVTDYPNCTEINGDVIIRDYPEDSALQNLEGLLQLTSISGNLTIENTYIGSLSGLNNLTSIGGSLTLLKNGNLDDSEGMNSLISVGGSLRIEGSPFENLEGFESLTTIGGGFIVYPDYQSYGDGEQVRSLSGIENLTSIGGLLGISDNEFITSLTPLSGVNSIGSLAIDLCPELTNLDGLQGITEIGSTLFIGINSGLTSLTGLDNLNTVSAMYIESNPLLDDISALSNLNSVASNMSILSNNSLTGLTGLENLTSGTFDFSIKNNPILEDISDLENIDYSEINDFEISNNPLLAVCHLPNICDFLSNGGTVTINNNAAGCNSADEVTDNCPGANDTTCLPGGIWFYNQEEVDNFAANYPDCTEILGSVTMNNTLIVNLNGLSQITAISGDLDLNTNTYLSDISGLSNLTSIGGDLDLSYNTNLENLEGLESLDSIGQDLIITFNTNLSSLTGMDNLTFIGNSISIEDNSNLTSIAALGNISSVTGNFRISDNGLSNLSDLVNLTTVDGDFRIISNLSLVQVNGLENLTTIGGNLDIEANLELINLDGLENLSSVGGNLNIYDNIELLSAEGLANLTTIGGELTVYDTKLMNLNGLENIDHTTITGLDINSNAYLSLCGVESICYYIAGEGPFNIFNNADGCNTEGEIIQSCASVWEYAVEGNIFMDADDNCLQDSTEQDLNGWIVRVENAQDTRYAYTYDNGKYVTPVDTGTYFVTPIPPNSLWEDMCFESDVAVLTPFNTRDTVNIGATTSTFCPLLEVDITAPFVRRCFDSNYYVRYCNSGTAVAEDAYVEVQLDPFFTYENATIAGVDLGENLYSFDLENIDIGECGSFRIDVYVDCDSTEIGQAHCVEAHIYPDTFCTSDLPLWDGASIQVNAQCLGDSIEFIIENVGTGDMSDSLEYLVIEENLIFQQANFKLNSGESKVFYKEANGLFHRLEAEQSPGHPGNSMPSVFVEGCGENDNGEISLGFVNYYLLDEGDAFVSIDCQENVGAYDPNDKQAFPVGYGEPHFITDSTDLEYLIRFQNTGTDTAFNIVIRDAISPHLNIETLRPGAASHPYRYDIEPGNIAVFHFENIMLPDSNVNEAASHGFIKFNIEQKENNPIGTHIMNDAAIYFDFNEPIITNTVFHTIGENFMGFVTSIITPPGVEEAGISVNVFPNPFDEYTRFEVQGEVVKELNLSVYDMMGREVFQQQSTHQQHLTMKRNNLTPGVYVFRLMDEKQQLATGKLIVK